MEWYKPQDKKPEQGKKVLCVYRGDIYVAQRFGKYWFSLPFHDSKYSLYKEPDLWQEIDFPEGMIGKVLFLFEDEDSLGKKNQELIDGDSLEKKCPAEFKEMVKWMKKSFKPK